jgi:RNA polymerase sigma-70 factor (ECF subfamily)
LVTKRSDIRGKGSVENFDTIFREYFIPLTWYARKYTGDVDSAKEIVHSVFVNTWEKREMLSFDSTIKSYLYTAVYNRSLNFLRDRAKFAKGDIEDLEYLANLPSDDHLGVESAETESIIYNEIEKLPDKCREIFKLNRFENKKYSEIAEQLNISVKTVEAQMSKALRVLREKLKELLTIIILLLSTYLF